MNYDVIVIGLGGVGSATVHALADQNVRVLGLDRFSPPHAFGSSHGETRIIRKAYFEHPDYVPLLQRAYQRWRNLEQETERDLLHLTGLLEIGPENGIVIPGVLRSAAEFGLVVERMTMRDAAARFRGIRGDEDWVVLLEQDAGYLRVEACVAAYLDQARVLGADLRLNDPVVDWQSDGQGVTVRTQTESFYANRVVIAAGPWSTEILSRYGMPLKVLRKHMYWYRGQPRWYEEQHGFPCYFFETPEGHFYGFPEIDGSGMKVARHSGGTLVSAPVDGQHAPDATDESLVGSFVATHLPDVDRSLMQTKGCYYTMTPDENFIVDRLPDTPSVVVVAGLSGHGFKFTSVLGELASQLALDQTPTLGIDFLRLQRF